MTVSQQNLIPSSDESENRLSVRQRVFRWIIGVVVGVAIAAVGWYMTRNWAWWLAIPVSALLIGTAKLRFPATW